MIKRTVEDGACLFRAVADQIFGDEEMHLTVRKYCMEYIVSNGQRTLLLVSWCVLTSHRAFTVAVETVVTTVFLASSPFRLLIVSWQLTFT